MDEAGGRPAHELRGLRVRGAAGRQSHGVRHRDAAQLRLRECEVRVVVRRRLPRHLALAGRIPERVLPRACVRRGRPASMAKFVYVGPRLSLTGMNADEWIAARPGTEGTLALAMAQVIMSQHLARVPAEASRLVSVLGAHRPSAVAQAIGIDADTIVRLAREFARSGGGLAVAGGMATQGANGAATVAAVNILNRSEERRVGKE